VTCVWITRALPGAAQTAEKVRALGAVALVAPLLEVRVLNVPSVNLQDAVALAFTSANGVRAFVTQSNERRVPVFAVGDSTAAAARAAGFSDVASAAGDVAALARLIAKKPLPEGVVVHIGAQEPAGDLTGALAAAGIAARRVETYKTAALQLSEADLAEVRRATVILVHSPRAAAVLRDNYLAAVNPRATFLCLSAAVAAPLNGLAGPTLLVAPSPREADLIAELAARLARA
jgi:uroporphyrinogen-III synthase